MQRAAGRAVDVVEIHLDDAAEPPHVEPRVGGEQRIAGPFDQVDAAIEGPLALRQLEPQAEGPAACLRRNAEEVRPLHDPAVAQAGHREDAADEPAAIVLGANQDAAGPDRDREHRSRHDVVVVGAPALLLQADHGVEIVDRVEIAQAHAGRVYRADGSG